MPSFQYVTSSQPQTGTKSCETAVGFFVHVPPVACPHDETLQYSFVAQSAATAGRHPFGPASTSPEEPDAPELPLDDVFPLELPPLDVEVLDVDPLDVDPPEVEPLDDVELVVSPPEEPKRSVSLDPPHAPIVLIPTNPQQAKNQALRTGRLRSKVQLRKLP